MSSCQKPTKSLTKLVGITVEARSKKGIRGVNRDVLGDSEEPLYGGKKAG